MKGGQPIHMKKTLLFPIPFVFLSALEIPLSAQDDVPKPKTIDASKFDSLQAALDAVPDSGGIVLLPPGTFRIKEPLVVKTPETRLEGAGASTHIVNLNEKGKPALHLRPATRDTDKKARLWRLQAENFRISGNPKSGDGLLAEGIQEIFIQGLSVDHHGGNGINLVDCYEDPRVTDSILTYNAKAGLRIEAGHDIVVNANHFEENQDGLQCVDSFNLCMNGNNLDDHLGNGVVIENTYGSVVSGNMIEECQGTAIILDRDCYGITLSANVIAHELEGGIDLRDAWGCAVSANTFTIVHKFSVRIGPDSGRIAVTGNNFCNSFIGGADKRPSEGDAPMKIDTGTGILIETTKNVAISGNVFTGIDGSAILATGKCAGIVATGNVIADFNRRNKDHPAIELGAATESIVEHNLVR